MHNDVLRLPAVLGLARMSHSWICLAVQEGRFPAPIQLGARAIGWKRSDLQAWLDSRQRVL